MGTPSVLLISRPRAATRGEHVCFSKRLLASKRKSESLHLRTPIMTRGRGGILVRELETWLVKGLLIFTSVSSSIHRFHGCSTQIAHATGRTLFKDHENCHCRAW